MAPTRSLTVNAPVAVTVNGQAAELSAAIGRQIIGTHGYVIDNGVFMPFDVPGSTYTDAYEINPAGAIVGSYIQAGKTHGYVLQNGNVTTIDFSNATYTDIRGINARGDVTGKFYDAGLRYKGAAKNLRLQHHNSPAILLNVPIQSGVLATNSGGKLDLAGSP